VEARDWFISSPLKPWESMASQHRLLRSLAGVPILREPNFKPLPERYGAVSEPGPFIP